MAEIVLSKFAILQWKFWINKTGFEIMASSLTLYRLETTEVTHIEKWPASLKGYKVVIHRPSLLNLWQYNANPLVNFLWYVFSFGRFRILFLLDKEVVVHFSIITPKVFRFPFMKKKDIQIGPCETNPNYQRQGIFTEVLRTTGMYYARQCDSLWTYTTIINIASQKAFERAGFIFYSYAKMNKFTKILKLVESLKE